MTDNQITSIENFVVSNVPVNGLAPLGAKTTAGTVFSVYKGPTTVGCIPNHLHAISAKLTHQWYIKLNINPSVFLIRPDHKTHVKWTMLLNALEQQFITLNIVFALTEAAT